MRPAPGLLARLISSSLPHPWQCVCLGGGVPEKVALTVTVIGCPFSKLTSSSEGPPIGKRGPCQVYHALHPTWAGLGLKRRLGRAEGARAEQGGGRTARRIPRTSALSVYLRVAGKGALGRSMEGVAARAGPEPAVSSPCSPRLGRVCVPLPPRPVSPSPTLPLRGRRGSGRAPSPAAAR